MKYIAEMHLIDEGKKSRHEINARSQKQARDVAKVLKQNLYAGKRVTILTYSINFPLAEAC